MPWKITADYFENCNCDVICPCIATPNLYADYERCHAPMISRIVEGEFDGVRLDGLAFVILEGEGNHWRASVPGLLDFELEGVVTTEGGEPVTVDNVHHPMGSRLPIGRSVKGVMSDTDFGLVYDNTGRNGHFNRYSWAA